VIEDIRRGFPPDEAQRRARLQFGSVESTKESYLGQGMRLTALGIFLGVVAAFWLTRWVSSLLFEITPVDQVTFSAVSVLVLVVALTACRIPARRAARIDPIQALREQ
jgi:ABC-type lipoprotein release transport system permease subunit